jgi:transposase
MANLDKYFTRANIVALYDGGLTMENISLKLNVSRTTISLWINRHRKSQTLTDRKKSGRKRKTTCEDDKT